MVYLDVKRVVIRYALIALVRVRYYQSRFIRKFVFDESMKDFPRSSLPAELAPA
jgi:hypothetical protein